MKKEELKRIGIEMQKMVAKAIKIIRAESRELIVSEKAAYDATKDDCVTNGDRKAQKMYIREIRRVFPSFGIIAEEKELRIPCTDPRGDIYITVDPLDGTKAYARGQSHGVGTMIALVWNGIITAAYIGDINTGEIYGYTAADRKGFAMRKRFGIASPLRPDIQRPLVRQYILLRHTPNTQPELIQKMYRPPEKGGLFKDIEVGGGSIGTAMARLWKGEIGAVCVNPHFETPWDLTPVLGISQRLGFIFLKMDPAGIDPNGAGDLREFEPEIITKVTESKFFQVIIHKKHLAEMREWIKENA